MESLEWRVKKLENKIAGARSGPPFCNTERYQDSRPICDQLNHVSKLYKNFTETSGERYSRFKELYEKHQKLLRDVEAPTAQVSDASKAELVLAYENDLVNHLESVKLMAEKADQVLDETKWPDLSKYRERLEKLETITRDQHLQSVNLDQRTEELIEIYNDIITAFKSNTVIWDQKLEAHENEERKMDEDE